MNPNPPNDKAKVIIDEAAHAAKQELVLTPEQQEEVTQATKKLARMLEIRKRIESMMFKNPYSNKRDRDDMIDALKEEHNGLRDEYIAAYEKYPFLPH